MKHGMCGLGIASLFVFLHNRGVSYVRMMIFQIPGGVEVLHASKGKEVRLAFVDNVTPMEFSSLS